jgi:hypothetical protein
MTPDEENTLKTRPDTCFDAPAAVTDREDLQYETRLEILQKWRARLAEGSANRGTRAQVDSAIKALQARAKLKMDTPEEQPETTTYGGVDRSDLRQYGARRLAKKLRGTFRR